MKSYQYKDQRGYLLVIAVFVILVLSTLSMSLLSLYDAQLHRSTHALQFQRSYYVGISAISLVYRDIKKDKLCHDKKFDFSIYDQALNGFIVDVRCFENKDYYQLTARTQYRTIHDLYYVNRTLSKQYPKI